MIRVTFQPDGRTARVEPGQTVVSAARQLGLHLNVPCGGRGVCGNCRVEVVKGAPAPTAAERKRLSPSDLAAGWRLACQAALHTDAVVAVPAITGAQGQRILTTGVEHTVTLRPNVRKLHLAVPPATLEDGRADADRFFAACEDAQEPSAISRQPSAIGTEVLTLLPRLLRETNGDVTAVIVGETVTWVEAGDTSTHLYGVAVDIGTTTVVGELFDLARGAQLAVASRTNPQTAIGDDVVSRIHHAATARGGLRDLQRRIVESLNEIVAELCRRAGVKRQFIYEMTVAGNTTMNHLFLGIDASQVAQAPYVAALRAGMHRPAADVGLRLGRGAQAYTLPNIAGFVGGDTVAVMLATDLGRRAEASGIGHRASVKKEIGEGQEVSESDRLAATRRGAFLSSRLQRPASSLVRLAVDIGTNGEMVLATADGLVACSTAAGPAFEGARITHGMRAASGAIEGVHLNGDDLELETIDHAPPRGLCGTGLIEAVATLLTLGVIDVTGRIVGPEDAPDLPPKIAARLAPGEHGLDVVLAPKESAGVPYDVKLTQRDVREVQLAKAAIAAGIQTLLAARGLAAAQIDEILLAGAFGNHICVEDAVRIGLLPNVPAERITFVGNAALSGARMVLLDATLRDEAERLSLTTRYLELAAHPEFQNAFAEAMLFPEKRESTADERG